MRCEASHSATHPKKHPKSRNFEPPYLHHNIMKLGEILCETFLRCKETIFRRYCKLLGVSSTLGVSTQNTYHPTRPSSPHSVSGPSYNNLPCRTIQYRTLRYFPLKHTKLHEVLLRSGGDIEVQKCDFLDCCGWLAKTLIFLSTFWLARRAHFSRTATFTL